MVRLLDLLFNLAQLAILAHVVASWLARLPTPPRWLRQPAVRFIDDLGFQLLRPFRRLLDATGLSGLTRGFDLSPLVALLVLRWVHALLARWLG